MYFHRGINGNWIELTFVCDSPTVGVGIEGSLEALEALLRGVYAEFGKF